MSVPLRFVLVLFTALLAACSHHSAVPPQAAWPLPEETSPATDDVLFSALSLVGTPYRWGGNTPDSGFDCSGLIGYVYREAAAVQLPRTTRALHAMGSPSVGRGALRSGDLLFFATAGGHRVSHAGIYVGEGRFVHAPSSGGTVRLDRLDDRYWQKTYLGAKRVLSDSLARTP